MQPGTQNIFSLVNADQEKSSYDYLGYFSNLSSYLDYSQQSIIQEQEINPTEFQKYIQNIIYVIISCDWLF